MTEYTVTAIRYTFGKGLSHEEGSRLAKEFIKSLKVGMKVILEAEPNNPADENAVAVYVRNDGVEIELVEVYLIGYTQLLMLLKQS